MAHSGVVAVICSSFEDKHLNNNEPIICKWPGARDDHTLSQGTSRLDLDELVCYLTIFKNPCIVRYSVVLLVFKLVL